ncbi:MAG TPA: CopD family protein [Methylotenera sp.]|nr:CopD family protein [Methylotenera sp.]
MQAFYDHPHLLDGALGRVFAYIAISVIIGKLVWANRLSPPLNKGYVHKLLIFTLGTLGLIIALNSTTLEASDPFGNKGMEFADGATTMEVLFKTEFGKAWLSFWGFLLIGIAVERLPIQCLAIAGMLAAMTFSSHAGSDFPYATYWIDYVHLASTLTWLGGLTLLIVLKFTQPAIIGVDEFKFFSRLALPVFLLALITGVARAAMEYLQSQTFATAYAVTLVIKIAMVLIIMAIAFSLRRNLQHGKFAMSAYENKLSTEYFFAILLILVVSILTQLPSD